MDINGSVAIVTGANRGIGEGFVRVLLAAGARRVYAGSRDPKARRAPGGGVSRTVRGDRVGCHRRGGSRGGGGALL